MTSRTIGLKRRALLSGAGMALAMPAIAQTAQTTLRFAALFPTDHSATRSSQWFADEVAKRTGGKLRVQVYPNAALGNEEEAAQGVRSGTIDLAYSGLPGFGGYIRELRVLEMPYLYDDLDQLKRVIDRVTPILDGLFANAGIRRIGAQFDGPRMTLATRPLATFADFKGLKFRVPQAPVYIEMAKAFGSIPTPIALPEAYTALQAHVADAIEGSASTLFAGKYYEVARNLVRTDHIFYSANVAINPGVFSRQPAEFQQVLLAAARDATDYNLQIAKAANQADLDLIVKTGVTVLNPPRAPFQAAVRTPNETYAASIGGKAQEVYAALREVTGH